MHGSSARYCFEMSALFNMTMKSELVCLYQKKYHLRAEYMKHINDKIPLRNLFYIIILNQLGFPSTV